MNLLSKYLLGCFLATQLIGAPLWASFTPESLKKKLSKAYSKDHVVNSWRPYWMYLNQPKRSSFFEASIGIGFLYPYQVRANFSPVPSIYADNFGGNAPFRRKLIYNRAPLYEYLLGLRLNSFWKLALSYQFQGGVTFQTEPYRGDGYASTIASNSLLSTFRTCLTLNSIQLKNVFEYPVPLIFKGIGFNPYLGIGLGAGWQSWTDLELNWVQTATFNTSATIIEQSFKQRICQNVNWMVDVGLRLRAACHEKPFFVLMGVKYNQWGQARNLGDLTQQGESKTGFLKPFRIKTLYSFAPYVAAQWNFPCYLGKNADHKVNGYATKGFKPKFVLLKNLKEVKVVWTEFNSGIGFLYFHKVRGALSSRPLDSINTLPSQVPLKRRNLSYNRSPLNEFLIGFRLFPYLKAAFSYQHQSDVSIATAPEPYINPNPALGLQNSVSTAQLRSNLMLDAVMGKVYLQPKKPVIFLNILFEPYVAVGFGPSWQTWTQVNVWRSTNNSNVALMSNAQPLRDKISANLAFLVDGGLQIQSIAKTSHFSLMMGIKYNRWGQAKNIGKIEEQNYRSFGLFPLFKIKTLYSFAPYLGVCWDYPIFNAKQGPIKICGKDANQLIPFFTPIENVEAISHMSFEYNIGSGFLYFHHVRGILSQRPSANGAGYPDIPILKRELAYNRAPLYEYDLAYKPCSWLKCALSYQTQRNMSVSTQFMKSANSNQLGNAVEFKANLKLDSLMIKTYFELPYAIIFKNLANSFYVAAATGGAWQSWTQIEYRLATNAARRSQYYQQKICASVAFSADVGFRVQSLSSKGAFCISKGIKYMQWGQARNLGDIRNQGSLNTGLFQPLRIQVIYSFIPYIGVQWNF